MKTEIEHLKLLYQTSITSKEQTTVATSSSSHLANEAYDATALYDRLRIKDKMLDDQNALVLDLRDKLGSYDKQIKTLKRDVRETESFLEEAKADISDLEIQLKMKHEIEQNLNELISRQQQQMQQQSSEDSSHRVCPHCNHSLDTTADSADHFNIFDEEDSPTNRVPPPSTPSSSSSSSSSSNSHTAADDTIRRQELENELLQSQQKLLSEQESSRRMETELQSLHNQKKQEIIQLEMKLVSALLCCLFMNVTFC